MGRIRLGDQSALAALYDNTSHMVFGLALRILGDPAIAEEVTLDVYMQVWRNANDFDHSRGKLMGWLLTIARSRAIDRRRSFSPEQLNSEPLEAAQEKQANLASPEELVAVSEDQKRVQAALRTLTPEQREAIELAYFFWSKPKRNC
jgi:RNA polymerase sigma-70 factor (ECF subfamily)